MLDIIRDYVKKSGSDAWIIYDFAATNPAFCKLFGKIFTTRKLFVIIDIYGNNTILCHSIDASGIRNAEISKEFSFVTYTNWKELIEKLKALLSRYRAAMMEISENGLLPRSSYADYGTVCLINSIIPRIVSSADAFQFLTATFDGPALESHKKAALEIDQIKNEAFDLISKTIKDKGMVSEYEVQQYILNRFDDFGLVTDSSPIVAIGTNANNPHYEPTKSNFSFIRKGDVVLIDLWAKKAEDCGVFADVTWMGFVGETAPQELVKVFDVVKEAIDRALDYIAKELPNHPVCGYEIDDICRKIITDYGYGEYFIHRTGHSISLGNSDHGVGVNIDNYETHDTRTLINNIAFSLEPGIYMPSFGLREEINVYISNNMPNVYTPRQEKIVLL